jgi:HSP20 family protein
LKRRKRILDNFWDFNFDEIFNEFEERINASMGSNSSEYQEGEPITFGYSIRVGSDTDFLPEIRQWGNVNDYRRKQGLPELHSPLKGSSEPLLPATSTLNEKFVDFIDEDNYLRIIVEVPGFTKENLSIDIDKEGLEISLKNKSENRALERIIKLPTKIKANETKSSIKNGVLEIRGKKKTDLSKKFPVKID